MNRSLNKIPYMEDERDIAVVAEPALESIGVFRGKVCRSNTRAVIVVPRFKPDPVPLDDMMPGMDGPSTLMASRKIPGFDRLPVIFMTAKAAREEVDRRRKMGALEANEKPFDPMMISGQIKNVWEKTIG